MNEKIADLLKKPVTKTLLSILLGFIAGAVALAFAGYNPFDSYALMFSSIFTSPDNLVQMVINSTPLIFTGLGVAFAFKTGLFNIGGEGQYIFGTVAAVMIGGKLNLPPVIHVIVVMLAAAVAGGLCGAFCGYLKAKFGINEVITCIMLNWIALYFNNYIVSLPGIKIPNTEYSFKVKQSAWINILTNWKNTAQGKAFLSHHDTLRTILLSTSINYGIIIAIVVVIAVWFLLNRTSAGFSLRAVGLNRDAAEFSGINVKRNIVVSMFIAGALCGLAGAVQVTSTLPYSLSTLSSQPGYGFNGITVALMANSSPVGCIFTSLLLAGLNIGGSTIQMNLGAPSEVINIMIGAIVFFVALSAMFSMIADIIKKRRKVNAH